MLYCLFPLCGQRSPPATRISPTLPTPSSRPNPRCQGHRREQVDLPRRRDAAAALRWQTPVGGAAIVREWARIKTGNAAKPVPSRGPNSRKLEEPADVNSPSFITGTIDEITVSLDAHRERSGNTVSDWLWALDFADVMIYWPTGLQNRQRTGKWRASLRAQPAGGLHFAAHH